MKKTGCLVVLAILVLIVAAFAMLPSIRREADGWLHYKGARYEFVSGYRQHDLGRPVARMGKTLVFSVADDPDRFFLYPKAILGLPWNLLVREDCPVLRDAEAIQTVTCGGAELDRETIEYLSSLFRGEHEPILTGREALEKGKEGRHLVLLFRFKEISALEYHAEITQFGTSYFLQLDRERHVDADYVTSLYVEVDPKIILLLDQLVAP